MFPTSPVSFQTTPSDPLIKRVETVGKVQPHVKAKIIGEDGQVLPIGRFTFPVRLLHPVDRRVQANPASFASRDTCFTKGECFVIGYCCLADES